MPSERAQRRIDRLLDEADAAAEPAAQLLAVGCLDQLAERLNPRPVGRGAASLVRAAPEQTRSVLGGVALKLARQPRLPDAGFAGDHHQAAATGACALERLAEPLKLLLSADKGLSGHDARSVDPMVTRGADYSNSEHDLAIVCAR